MTMNTDQPPWEEDFPEPPEPDFPEPPQERQQAQPRQRLKPEPEEEPEEPKESYAWNFFWRLPTRLDYYKEHQPEPVCVRCENSMFSTFFDKDYVKKQVCFCRVTHQYVDVTMIACDGAGPPSNDEQDGLVRAITDAVPPDPLATLTTEKLLQRLDEHERLQRR